MTENQSVIVYRSRWEKDADEFWSENPEFILYGVLLFIAFALAMTWLGRRK